MGVPLPLECSRVWEQVQWVDQDEEGLAVAQVLEGLVLELAGLGTILNRPFLYLSQASLRPVVVVPESTCRSILLEKVWYTGGTKGREDTRRTFTVTSST